MPVILHVIDAGNPVLNHRLVVCDDHEHAAVMTEQINRKFPLTEVRRSFAVTQGVDTPEQFFENCEQDAKALTKTIEKQRHDLIRRYVSDVEKGYLKADLDGQEIGAFELMAMNDEDLARVMFTATGDSPYAAEVRRILRAFGLRVVE